MPHIIAIVLMPLLCTKTAVNQDLNSIEKNGMVVKWKFVDDRLLLTISAPTNGWIAIGFNENTDLTGTYLLMSRIINSHQDTQEYTVLSPGTYKSITALGGNSEVINVTHQQKEGFTQISYSIPQEQSHAFGKHLKSESVHNLVLAYSLVTDFQHHSIMRSHLTIRL